MKADSSNCRNRDRRRDLVALTKHPKGFEDYTFVLKQPHELTRREIQASEARRSSLAAERSNGEIASEFRKIKLLKVVRNLPKEFSEHIRLPFCSLRRRTTKCGAHPRTRVPFAQPEESVHVSRYHSTNSCTESFKGPDYLRRGTWHIVSRGLRAVAKGAGACADSEPFDCIVALFYIFKFKTIVTKMSLGPSSIGAGHPKPKVVKVM